jgi:hypothetical protein
VLSIRGLGCEFSRALLEFSGGGACFSCSAELDVQDHLSRADLGQSLMASPMTIDYLYQRIIGLRAGRRIYRPDAADQQSRDAAPFQG